MTDNFFDLSDYDSGTVIFAAPDDGYSVDDAKQFIIDKNIDKTLVKLIRYTVFLENGKEVKTIALIVK